MSDSFKSEFVSDTLEFWMELFDKESKSEAADRSQSKFKWYGYWHGRNTKNKQTKKKGIKELF